MENKDNKHRLIEISDELVSCVGDERSGCDFVVVVRDFSRLLQEYAKELIKVSSEAEEPNRNIQPLSPDIISMGGGIEKFNNKYQIGKW